MSFKLLQEYAVDPACINGWQALQLLASGFGVAKGRIIARYPKDWRRSVYDRLATTGTLSDSKVELVLGRLGRAVLTTGRPKRLSRSTFVDSAMTEHLQRPFHAILTSTNPDANSCVLIVDEIHDDHVLWQATTERAVPRRSECYVEAIGELLRGCGDLQLIDPYFHPSKPRYQRPLKAIANEVAQNARLTKIQYHVQKSNEWQIADFERACHQELEFLVPTGLTLEILIWSCRLGGQDFHARYILTDKGGVRVEQGLDDNLSAASTTDMSILSDLLYSQRRSDFDAGSGTSAFDLLHRFDVIGQRKRASSRP